MQRSPYMVDPTSSEDPEREPDGIPHAVMAGIAVAIIVIAAMLLLLLSGHVPRFRGALFVLAAGVPALILTVTMIARAWRGPTAHPSR
jgi:lysylphosphatidylglycerol synthetase-like protein (DUF2156 family)